MKRTALSLFFLVAVCGIIWGQQGRFAKVYAESSQGVRGGFYTMYGLGATVGWQAKSSFGIGVGVEYLAYHYNAIVFSGQLRGYGAKPGWDRLYYSLKAGIGPLFLSSAPQLPDDGGHIFIGDVELGLRMTPWFTLATGYSGWRHKRIHRDLFIGAIREEATYHAQHTLSVRGIFTFDGAGKALPKLSKLYGYAFVGLIGGARVSYPNFTTQRVNERTGHVGMGYNLNKRWGIGLGVSGLAAVTVFETANLRRMQGAGIQAMFVEKWLVAMGEVGYAVRAEDGLSDYLFYEFSPGVDRGVGHAVYVRAAGGIRLWNKVLLMLSVLGTPPSWGRERYSDFDPNTGQIVYALQQVRRSMYSAQIGIGYLVGRP